MKAENMWEKFIKERRIEKEKYEAWSFGGSPDKLAELVLKGEKTATASAYDLYEIAKLPLPKVGEYSIILDSKNEAKCIIQTKRVYVVPFNKVTEEHAYKEGEGDKSLTYWKSIHKEFFTECLNEVELPFNTSMKVVCEEFELVYK